MFVLTLYDDAGNPLKQLDVDKYDRRWDRLSGKFGTWDCVRKLETKEAVLKSFSEAVGVSKETIAKFLDEYNKAVS